MQKALPIISKKFLIVLMAVMLVASMILFISPGKIYGTPKTWYVAASPVGSDSNAGTSAAPFATIQTAVTAASDDDTIQVAAGTYNESITISNSITLNGAKMGMDTNSRTAGDANESSITGKITVSADIVSINGFTLSNPSGTYGTFISPNHNNVIITFNIINLVGGTGQVKGVYIQHGSDDITIAHNLFSNISATTTKSADAICVGDSNSTDPSNSILIQDNVFINITSLAKGAYGILVNNGAGTGAQILDNTFSNLSGDWTHAIGLEGPTKDSIVKGNIFSNLNASSTDNAAIHFEDNQYGNTVVVTNNRFNGNGFYGVLINPDDLPGGTNSFSYIVNATNNWWENASGPKHLTNPSGTGNAVSDNVAFFPWTGYVAPTPPPGTPVYTITASTSGNGSITPSGAFNISANAGQVYNIAPNAGASITDVLVDGSSVGPVSSYTFTGVNSNRTIQAIFSGGSGGIGVLGIDESMIGVLGISNADYSGFVTRCYRSILLREPDASGLSGWVNALSGGLTGEDVASGFVYSAELAPYLTALDNTGYLNFLYSRVLGRAADLSGLNGWLSDMSGGMTRAEILVYFLNSPEWQTICNAYGVTP